MQNIDMILRCRVKRISLCGAFLLAKRIFQFTEDLSFGDSAGEGKGLRIKHYIKIRRE